MKPHSELMAMSQTELTTYLHEEAERLIAATSPHNQLKMRALQAQCDGIRKKYRNPVVSCGKIYSLMESRFFELNDALLKFRAR